MKTYLMVVNCWEGTETALGQILGPFQTREEGRGFADKIDRAYDKREEEGFGDWDGERPAFIPLSEEAAALLAREEGWDGKPSWTIALPESYLEEFADEYLED